MERGLTYTKTVTMVTEVCCNCGVIFGLLSDFRDECIRMGYSKSFYCPNGHGQSYTKSEAQKLKEKFEKEKAELDKRNSETVDRMLDETSKRLEAEKKLRRIHKGVCPCCNRSFLNLQKHMQTKHPDVAGKIVVDPIHTKINKRNSKYPK